MSISEPSIVESCKVCGRPAPGNVFPLEAVVGVQEIEDRHVEAYRCRCCGVTVCLGCMQARVRKGDLERTPCPACGKAFGPASVVVKADLEDSLKRKIQGNQAALERQRERIPIDWFSALYGIACVIIGFYLLDLIRNSSRFGDPKAWTWDFPHTAVLMMFGVGALSFVAGLLPLLWQSPGVLVVQGAAALATASMALVGWLQSRDSQLILAGIVLLVVAVLKMVKFINLRKIARASVLL